MKPCLFLLFACSAFLYSSCGCVERYPITWKVEPEKGSSLENLWRDLEGKKEMIVYTSRVISSPSARLAAHPAPELEDKVRKGILSYRGGEIDRLGHEPFEQTRLVACDELDTYKHTNVVSSADIRVGNSSLAWFWSTGKKYRDTLFFRSTDGVVAFKIEGIDALIRSELDKQKEGLKFNTTSILDTGRGN